MAPSSLDASFINSTSGLLSVLDLNQQQSQNMEDMDIDQVIDVPDTPDRLAGRNINGGECVDKESESSVAGHSENSVFADEGVLNRLRGRGRLATEHGHGRRLHFHSRRNMNNLDETERHSSSIVSSLESSSASRSAHLFRRMIAGKTSKQESEHSIGARHMDKGKALCTKFTIKSSACQENNTVLNSNEQNGHIQILEKAFPRGASKNPLAEEIRKGSIATCERSSLHCIANSSKASGNLCKGKEKTDDATFKGAGLGMDHGNGTDFSSVSQPKTKKYMPASLHSIISPRVTGQKRLVRNGCISPHNIARAKQFAERNSSSSKDIECNDTGNVVSNGPPCLIDVSDSIAEDINSNRVKGKAVIIHPWMSKEHDARTRHLSGRSPIIHNEEASGARDASRDAFGGLGGWRSTRNRSKKIGLPLSDEAGCLSRRNDGVKCNQHEKRVDNRDNRIGNNSRAEGDYPEVWDAVFSQQGQAPPLVQVASSLVSESDQVDGQHRVTNTLIKRQKKHGSTLSNHGECSTSGFGNSEIVFLGSSGNPLNSRSSRNQSHHRRGILDPVIEIDDLSPEIGPSDSLNIGCVNNDVSDTRARQVEADEILARELQEQLYQEVPVVGASEIDAHIAWTLQQQEGSQRASSSESHHMLHPRGSSISPIYRQSRPRSFQNPSNRRGTQARVPTSTRMARLRSRIRGQSPTILSRERNLRFPLNMDLDMRIDILEALEAAVGDFSDMRMASHMLQVQRDFNENDYEMLLALDENNHQLGASINQISSLPESTVQTDNFEEACAICLETPTFGDTIRHLPCLHKFHKDCIDPWLSRRTSCPICKSSIG